MGRIIICFTGIDGSGKTTLARLMVKELKRRGIKSKYLWCRWFPGFADPYHFLIRKTLGITVGQYNSLRIVKRIYECLIVVDFSVWLFFRVKLAKCSAIVLDRYVYDALADMYLAGLVLSPFFLRLFLGMNPEPTITFLVEAPLNQVLSRRREMSIVEAKKYKNIFAKLARNYGFRKIINIDLKQAEQKLLTEIGPLIDKTS